jgi:hypothetical protein
LRDFRFSLWVYAVVFTLAEVFSNNEFRNIEE